MQITSYVAKNKPAHAAGYLKCPVCGWVIPGDLDFLARVSDLYPKVVGYFVHKSCYSEANRLAAADLLSSYQDQY